MDALLKCLSPFQRQCILIAYSDAALDYAQQQGGIDTGWVLGNYDQQHLERAKQLGPQFLICDERKIPAGETPWHGNWQWMLYDINDPKSALQWSARGVALIETSHRISKRCCNTRCFPARHAGMDCDTGFHRSRDTLLHMDTSTCPRLLPPRREQADTRTLRLPEYIQFNHQSAAVSHLHASAAADQSADRHCASPYARVACG